MSLMEKFNVTVLLEMRGTAHHIGHHKTLSTQGPGSLERGELRLCLQVDGSGGIGGMRESPVGRELRAYVRVCGWGFVI